MTGRVGDPNQPTEVQEGRVSSGLNAGRSLVVDMADVEKIMKTLARVAATFTFICFFSPGAWLLFAIAHASPVAEPIAFVLGFVLLGLAFSLGPFLWLAGEKWCPKQDDR